MAVDASRGGERGAGSSAKSAREALLEAATLLFGEAGPAAVSTRQIAKAADVNSGLIHRHFRTKDALLKEVLERLAREISESAKEAVDEAPELLRFFDATYERALYWRLLARCILDGKDLSEIQTEFPTVERIVETLGRLQGDGAIRDDIEPKVLTGVLLAMGLGWLVFEPFLLAATGLDERDSKEVRRDARLAGVRLLARSD